MNIWMLHKWALKATASVQSITDNDDELKKIGFLQAAVKQHKINCLNAPSLRKLDKQVNYI